MVARATWVLILAIFVCAVGVFISPAAAGTVPVTQITHPEKTFSDGKAHHFSFKTEEGVAIRYFMIKSSDGVIRAAFDACDVCWPENKGYSQKGDFMVCNNCGMRFASTKINEVRGGCNPSPLNRKVADGNVIIQVTDLLQGKRYFDFRGGKR